MIYLQLFWSFVQIGLFSVGGGYAAIALIQSQAVERYAWLTLAEFTDLVTISEMTPGPIAVNSATFVGTRVAGAAGAVAATLGCILPSCVIVTLLAYIYFRYRKLSLMRDLLNSLRPAVVALIGSAGLTILLTVLFPGGVRALSGLDWAGAALFAGAFIVLRLKKLNPIITMFICGAAYLALNLALPA